MFIVLQDYIMGGPIGYSSTDTGTRQPVVIMLRPAENEDIKCRLGSVELSIHELQDAMKHVMTQSETVQAEELELEIAVPGGVHAVFVDLPGIKVSALAGRVASCAKTSVYMLNAFLLDPGRFKAGS